MVIRRWARIGLSSLKGALGLAIAASLVGAAVGQSTPGTQPWWILSFKKDGVAWTIVAHQDGNRIQVIHQRSQGGGQSITGSESDLTNLDSQAIDELNGFVQDKKPLYVARLTQPAYRDLLAQKGYKVVAGSALDVENDIPSYSMPLQPKEDRESFIQAAVSAGQGTREEYTGPSVFIGSKLVDVVKNGPVKPEPPEVHSGKPGDSYWLVEHVMGTMAEAFAIHRTGSTTQVTQLTAFGQPKLGKSGGFDEIERWTVSSFTNAPTVQRMNLSGGFEMSHVDDPEYRARKKDSGFVCREVSPETAKGTAEGHITPEFENFMVWATKIATENLVRPPKEQEQPSFPQKPDPNAVQGKIEMPGVTFPTSAPIMRPSKPIRLDERAVRRIVDEARKKLQGLAKERAQVEVQLEEADQKMAAGGSHTAVFDLEDREQLEDGKIFEVANQMGNDLRNKFSLVEKGQVDTVTQREIYRLQPEIKNSGVSTAQTQMPAQSRKISAFESNYEDSLTFGLGQMVGQLSMSGMGTHFQPPMGPDMTKDPVWALQNKIVSFSARGEDAQHLFQRLSKQYGFPLDIGQGVTGKVTVKVSKAPLYTAISYICSQTHAGLYMNQDGKTWTIQPSGRP